MANKSANNKILREIIGLVVLVIVAILVLNWKNIPNKATLLISTGENKQRIFEGEVNDNMTILQAVYSASVGGKFDFRYFMDKPDKTKLYSIDGNINGAGKQWFFFLNGKPVSADLLNQTRIKGGDIVEAKYR